MKLRTMNDRLIGFGLIFFLVLLNFGMAALSLQQPTLERSLRDMGGYQQEEPASPQTSPFLMSEHRIIG